MRETPPILSGSEAEQLRQIRAYLVRLNGYIDELDLNLTQSIERYAQSAGASTDVVSMSFFQSKYNQLKALIEGGGKPLPEKLPNPYALTINGISYDGSEAVDLKFEFLPKYIIAVTYPAGSVCTCSDGDITLTAADTSGRFLFNVPHAGTWTVTSAVGDKSASTAASLTEEYEAALVSLEYMLYIYNSGVISIPITLNKQSSASLTDNGTTIVSSYSGSGNTVSSIRTTSMVDITKYKKFCVQLNTTAVTSGTYGGKLGVTSQAITASGSPTWVTTQALTTGDSIAELDISSLSGEYYLAVWGTMRTTISKIWLE